MDLKNLREKVEGLLEKWYSLPEERQKSELKEIHQSLMQARRQLAKIEHTYRILRSLADKKGMMLPSSGKEEELTSIAERLQGVGYKVKNRHPALRESLEKIGFRLMELLRAGRREEAFYLLLRTYMAHGGGFPRNLAYAFSPAFHPEETQLLVYHFLSAVNS
ncbi:MAG: hypothetical protein KatS3mg025_0121 [Bacteroidia bacterium]|nr:MAG: hypothetical protein KatS3mg025_0121 [Bacteroidia bacterium]